MSARQAVNVVGDVDKSRHNGLIVADRNGDMGMETQYILHGVPERDIMLIVLRTLMVRGIVRRQEMRTDGVKQGKHSSCFQLRQTSESLIALRIKSHGRFIRDNTLHVAIERLLSPP